MNTNLCDGIICQKNHCHHCCIETEMILTKKEISYISKRLSIPPEDFCFINEDGFRLLKNKTIKKEKRCYFLDNMNFCSIYEFRPLGCRFYPIVWNLELHEALVDDYCPHFKKFDYRISVLKNELETFILKIFGRF